MTTEEKAAAFDMLAKALTNRWHDGRWSWWCRTPPGGSPRITREEAVADLVAWAKRQKDQGGEVFRVGSSPGKVAGIMSELVHG